MIILWWMLCLLGANGQKILRCCGEDEDLLEETDRCERRTDMSKPWSLAMVQGPPGNSNIVKLTSLPKNWTVEQGKPPCSGMEMLFFLPGTNVVIMESGELFNGQFYNKSQFCISKAGYLICVPRKNKIVKKCCDKGSVYSEKKNSCTTKEAGNFPNFVSEDISIQAGFPNCEEHVTIGLLDEKFSLNEDGTPMGKDGRKLNKSCVEHILEYPNQTASVFTCAKPRPYDIRYTLFPVGFFISCLFLTITLIASCMLPATYHALHWKCQTNYVACLLLGCFILAITQLNGHTWNIYGISCVAVATAMHFLFLSAFFWLNTMCFNIWWTFRDLRPTSLDKSQENCRLKLYELYAWGGPLVIVGIGALMDHILDDAGAVRPRFGERKCWFHGDSAEFVYFFLPIGILLMVNLILFVITTRELTCGLWKTEVVKSTTERTALSHICLKLVIVMGITWIMDVLSWAVGDPPYLFYISDSVNALQGVFIFIVVGCQPQMWSALKRIWYLGRDASSQQPNNSSVPSVINDNSTLAKPTVETIC